MPVKSAEVSAIVAKSDSNSPSSSSSAENNPSFLKEANKKGNGEEQTWLIEHVLSSSVVAIRKTNKEIQERTSPYNSQDPNAVD